MAPVARSSSGVDKKRVKMSSESKKPRKTTPDSPLVVQNKRVSKSERKAALKEEERRLPRTSGRNLGKQLKASIKSKTQNEEAENEEKENVKDPPVLTDQTEVEKTTDDLETVEEGMIKTFFEGVFPIDIEFGGGKLATIYGTEESATRITKKFKAMKKLGHHVGYGLDCHFRMFDRGFELLMLIRGTPKSVFGANLRVIPELDNIRNLASPASFIEAAQTSFFASVLQLLPTRLKDGKELLMAALNKGEENDNVLKFYDFLKDIRKGVNKHIASIPIAWIADQSDAIQPNVSKTIRDEMQLCGDNQLVKLEEKQPSFAEDWQHELGLKPDVQFDQLMDSMFESY